MGTCVERHWHAAVTEYVVHIPASTVAPSHAARCRFYDRDVSAALNIRRCAVGPGPRPTELCYWTNRPAMPKPGQPGQEWVEIPDKPLLLKWQRKLQQ
ncbi:hypothetical protein QJQ45_009391 [Haematococcus lacustris]|nr:hypothetical protein QJQ45_009391 [Haematococcus lacustris]